MSRSEAEDSYLFQQGHETAIPKAQTPYYLLPYQFAESTTNLTSNSLRSIFWFTRKTEPSSIPSSTRPLLRSEPTLLPTNYGSLSSGRSSHRRESDLSSHDDDGEHAGRWWIDRTLLRPHRKAVRAMVATWWKRWAVMVFLPAGIAIAWCAIPFPMKPLEETPVRGYYLNHGNATSREALGGRVGAGRQLVEFALAKIIPEVLRLMGEETGKEPPKLLPAPPQKPGSGPGHGEAQVRVNFWFFLIVYYGFYNLVGLFMITKLFNLYSLNWWPAKLGFPLSYTFFWSLSLLLSLPLHYFAPSLTYHNMTWIFLTVYTMACPLLLAFYSLHTHRTRRTHSALLSTALFSPHSLPPTTTRGHHRHYRLRPKRSRPSLLPASYIRFLWFTTALTTALLALILAEAYAEIYLRTLPHTNLETAIYVYSWVATIYTLDLLTSWIIGARVSSYPLQWVFKFYFQLTYHVYVRAIYARLRNPGQFVVLQAVSSSLSTLLPPILMHPRTHQLLFLTGLTTIHYPEYQKLQGRNIHIRGLSESITMLAWLGWVFTLHYGYNKEAYPYFSFDGKEGERYEYNFGLTVWGSAVMWGCEVLSGWVVRRCVRWAYGFEVTKEGGRDVVGFPELVPCAAAVAVHVCQNMLFGIVRLRFWC